VAIGASVAGKVVDVAGANRAFLVATVSAAVAAVVVASFQQLLHVSAEPVAAPVQNSRLERIGTEQAGVDW
jgi:NhaP-type Na+/H+ and K+/H+ antiporter